MGEQINCACRWGRFAIVIARVQAPVQQDLGFGVLADAMIQSVNASQPPVTYRSMMTKMEEYVTSYSLFLTRGHKQDLSVCSGLELRT